MKPEEKKGLGRVLRKHLKALNYTQERLAGAAGINSRTVQRALGGQGISKENLSAIASVLRLDEQEILKEAASVGPPSPDKRIALQLVRSGRALVEVLERYVDRGGTLELNPPDEHSYNDMVGEDIAELADDLERSTRSELERVKRVRHAQGIVSFSHKFGFHLFAGNYIEEFVVKKRPQRKRVTLIIAASVRDSRIISTAKGPVLDVVRDTRRLLMNTALAGHATNYNWFEDQLMSKSDGEFRVKNELRRIMGEVMAEMNQAEERERKP